MASKEFTLSLLFKVVDRATAPLRKVGGAITRVGKSTGLDRVVIATGALFAGLGRAGREAVAFGSRVAAGTAAASAALFALVKRSAGFADSLAKTARKLGLSVETLQQLRYSASLAGIAQGKLDVATQRFTRRIAEAAAGTGVAKDALAALGIQLKDGNGNIRATEDLLFDVADRMAAIEDPAKRVRLAFTLFDTEGVDMVNMLGQGSAAMRAQFEEARRLGLITEKNARQSEDFNDAWTKLVHVVGRLGDTIAAELLPSMEQGVEGLREWFIAMRPVIVERMSSAISEVGALISWVTSSWSAWTEQMDAWTKAAILVSPFLANIVARATGLIRNLGATRVVVGLLAAVLGVKLLFAVVALFVPLAKLSVALALASVRMVILATRGVRAAAIGLLSLPRIMGAVIASLARLSAALARTAARMVSLAARGIAAAVSGLVAMLPALGSMIAATWAWTAALLANPLTWIFVAIMAALAAVVGGMYLLIRHWDQVVAAFEAGWEAIKGAFQAAWSGIERAFQRVWIRIVIVAERALSAIAETVASWWRSIGAGTVEAWAALSDTVASAWSGVAGAFRSAWTGIGAVLTNAWSGIVTAFRDDVLGGILRELSTFHPAAIVLRAIDAIGRSLLGVSLIEDGRRIFGSFLAGLVAGVAQLRAWAADVTVGARAWFAGIDLVAAGGAIVGGLLAGMVTTWSGVEGWFAGALATVSEGLELGTLAAVGTGIVAAMWTSMTRAWQRVVSGLRNAIDALGLGLPVAALTSVGEALADGLLSGLKGAWGAVTDWLTSALDGLDTFLGAKIDRMLGWIRRRVDEITDFLPDFIKEEIGLSLPEPASRDSAPERTAFQSALGPGSQEIGGEVKVTFENAPPSMRIAQTRSRTPGVDISVDAGYAAGGGGGF